MIFIGTYPVAGSNLSAVDGIRIWSQAVDSKILVFSYVGSGVSCSGLNPDSTTYWLSDPSVPQSFIFKVKILIVFTSGF